jgi:hypothetical protein
MSNVNLSETAPTKFQDIRAPAFPFYISYTARARGRCWPGRGRWLCE